MHGGVVVGIEQFIVSDFNKFIMVDGKPIRNQINEFQELLRGVERKRHNFNLMKTLKYLAS